MSKVTIKDLSRLLELSTSTVSRALADHPDISDSTKKKVRALAQELNYKKNVHAQFFRSQNSGLIALIIPEVNTFFSPSLLKGINKVIASSKYSLITFLTNDDYEREKDAIEHCLKWNVEGVLLCLSKETYDLDHLVALKKSDIKCVLVDKILETTLFSTVTIDSEEASNKAIQYLLNKGHRDILGLFGNPSFSITKKRIEGYKKAFEEFGVNYKDERIIVAENFNSYDFILPSLLQNNRPSAIFSMSDEITTRVTYNCEKLNLKIPDDITLITISDGVLPYFKYPQITHIKDSGHKMGVEACNLLIENIKGDKNPQKLKLPTQLIELDSTITF